MFTGHINIVVGEGNYTEVVLRLLREVLFIFAEGSFIFFLLFPEILIIISTKRAIFIKD